MRNRIFFKLLAAFLIVIVAATVIFDVAFRGAWQSSLHSEIQRNLEQKTALLAHRVEAGGARSLADIAAQEGQAAGARATIIDVSGQVLADSESNPAGLQNQAHFSEFSAALAGRTGFAQRRSSTVDILYVAVPISGGAVRFAYPLADVDAVSAQVSRRLALGSALAFLIALLVAAVAATSTARRLDHIAGVAAHIAAGDLGARVQDSSPDEIGRLAMALDKTAGQVEHSFAALRSSQRQLETLLNSMQDAVIAVSADRVVQWANQSMDCLAPQRTRLHAPVVETIRDPDFLAAINEAIEHKQVKTTRATSIAPGRAFDVTAAPLPGGGAVAVLRDLTETERVEKTRRDFIANVSHELRTPLTSIQGYSETLLDGATDNGAASREFLEIIRKNAARMARLTEDLLILARVESGETRFDPEPVSPLDLLRDAEESFREITRSHGVELQIQNSQPNHLQAVHSQSADLQGDELHSNDLQSDDVQSNESHKDDSQIVDSRSSDSPVATHSLELLPRVLADREFIHQVFSNLIDNAMKYGRSGGRIFLGARPVPCAIEFYVRDFGAGIPSEHLPRLFERFYGIDKARSRESGGTGLGLAIAKHIILEHHGSIRAESELNHGSTFLFTLPTA